MLRPTMLATLLALAACAGMPVTPAADVLILGEQHDAKGHPQLHQRVIAELAATGRLAALALEMAEAGRSTRGLGPDASEAQVRDALGWDERAWPWTRYAGVVMAAVRARVPVAGANLPRARVREAGADAGLDAAVGASVMQAQVEAVREGHCGLLPQDRLVPMARMQVARDRAMAQALAALAVPGRTSVLVAGARHALPQAGVPLHLPRHLSAETRIWPAEAPQEDHCARLRQQWGPR